MTLLWWTNEAGDARVDYGTTLALGHTATAAEPEACAVGAAGTCHRVDLGGLSPGAEYFYRLITNGTVVQEASAAISFRALRAAGDTAPLTFAVVGDFGAYPAGTQCYPDGCPSLKIAAQIAAKRPDLVLAVGDNAYEGLATRLLDWEQKVLVPYRPVLATAPMFLALGNHDLRRSGGSHDADLTEWTAAHPQRAIFAAPVNGSPGGAREGAWYALDTGPATFLVVNSNFQPTQVQDWTSGDQQKLWLWNRLQPGASRKWKLAAGHHTPYSCANGRCASGVKEGRGCGTDADCDGQTCRLGASGSSTWNARWRFSPLFEAFGVQLSFWGHEHFWERSRWLDDFDGASLASDPSTNSPNGDGLGTRYLTVGGGGAGLDGGARLAASGSLSGQPVDQNGGLCAPGGGDTVPFVAAGCSYDGTGYCSTGARYSFAFCTLADPTLSCAGIDADGVTFDTFSIEDPAPSPTASPTP